MEEREQRRKPQEGGDWLGLFSFGFFLTLLGTLWIMTPNLTEEVIDFFKDFQLTRLTLMKGVFRPSRNPKPAVRLIP